MAIPQKYEQYPAPAGTQWPHPLVNTRRNLIKNPRQEVDTSGWTPGGGGAGMIYTRASAAYTNFGEGGPTASYQFVGNTGASGYQEVSVYWVGTSGWGEPCNPGATFTASVYSKVWSCDRAAYTQPQVFLRFYTLAGAMITQTSTMGPLGQGAAVINRTQRIVHTATAPGNAAYVQPIFLFGGSDPAPLGGAVNINVTCGGFMLEESGAVGVYFDGGTTAGAWWEGTADASYSGAYKELGSRNLVLNPSFEVDTSNWGVDAGSGTVNKSRVTSAGGVVSGSACLQLDGTIGASGYFLANGETKSWGVTELETYTASLTFNGQDQLSAGVDVGLIWFDAFSSYLSENHSVRTTATGSNRISITAQAPLHARYVQVRFQGGGANGETYGFWVDAVMLEKTSVRNPYFDGSTGQTNWGSTANASYSYQLSPGGMWIDLGSAVGGLGGLSKVEMKFPPTGVSYGAISRTPANRRQATIEMAPGVSRSPYVLEQPYNDNFLRPNESTVLPPMNTDGWMRLVDHQLTPTAGHNYGYAGSNFTLDLPMVVRVKMGSTATPSTTSGWDNYLELGSDPINGNNPESLEFGWFRRYDWGGELADGLDHWSVWWLNPLGEGLGGTLRIFPVPGDPLGTAPMPGPLVKNGDEFALAYDGVSAICMRKPVGLPWMLLGRVPLSNAPFRPTQRQLYGGVWVAQYAADSGGLNGIGSFSYGRF